MIIRLDQSVLFTDDPGIRFGKKYGVHYSLWSDMWKKYKLLDYTIEDLADFYQAKTKRQIHPKSLRRWIWRTEIYSMANPVMKKGARVVNSEFFGQYEWELISELTKNTSVNDSPKVLL